MPFPQTKRQAYKKNPIQEVICQVRFPTILDISANPPAGFQNLVRQNYPLFEQGRSGPMGIPKGVPEEISKLVESLTPTTLAAPEYRFSTADKDRTIAFSQDFLAFTSNKYDRWENFLAGFQFAEAAFKETYGPAFYSRVGLRYIDVVDRGELGLDAYNWGELFNPEFAGLLGANSIGEAVEEARAQVLLRLGEGSNLVRINHGFAKRASDGYIVYSIDADFFTSNRTEIDHVGETLNIFNRCAGHFFRWAISDKLRDALEPTDIVG